MRELTIGKKRAGVRLDRFVSKALPLLPPALLQKYIRIKRIKVNGGRAQRDQRLAEGDAVQLYINDEFFDKPSEENMFLTLFKPQVDIVYEDENLLLVNKRPGLVVHADETEKVNTPINHIQAYLYQKREWNPGGRTPLHRPCATASTATPAAWSSPPRTPRRCASSTRRSACGRSTSGICASPWGSPSRRRAASSASS